MVDWAEAMGIESIVIDKNTDIRALKNEMRWNSVVYR
jgi:L-arabinose isomerase